MSSLAPVERRALATEFRTKGRTLHGIAAPFNSKTRINDFEEVIAPGAFTETLRSNPDILALVDHNSGRVLARTRNGSLRLSETGDGLAFEIDMPRTSLADDILALAEARTLGGMSFGFNVPAGGDEWRGSQRTLKKVNLHEVSVVNAVPAYATSSVSVRSRPPTDLQAFLRRLALLEVGG